MTYAIRLEHLNLALQGKSILHDLTFGIKTETVTCVMGPSGSGKSTLLRCCNRLAEPPVGSIFLNEHDITTLPVRTLRRRVGMVAQRPALFPGTVWANLAYPAQVHGQPFTHAQACDLLNQVDLDPEQYLQQDVQTLSGGEAQRVALVRTMANNPEVLLLDEPTAALDPTSTRLVEAALLNIQQQRSLTMLWISHDPSQVLRVGSYVFLLVQGRLRDQGTPQHVFRADSAHAVKQFAEGKWS